MEGARYLAHRCLSMLIPAADANTCLSLPVLAEHGLRKLSMTRKWAMCGPRDARGGTEHSERAQEGQRETCVPVAERKACGLVEAGRIAWVPSLLSMTLGRADIVMREG